MAAARLALCIAIITHVFVTHLAETHVTHRLKACGLDAIYQVGDSLADTGNLIRERPVGSATAFARLPYGQALSRGPTGRCSDGLLMIDFLALAAGLPLLNPYMMKKANFSNGVNYAVAGSTALSTQLLRQRGIISPLTNSSLDIQLGRMNSHLNTICRSRQDCLKKLQKSLFMVGEIGVNDYNFAFLQGKSIDELKKTIVPLVVRAIKGAARDVLRRGASLAVIPGNFPIGCLPLYLTIFKTNDSTEYDEFNCLKRLNEFSTHHNSRLRIAIEELRREYPGVLITYVDCYNAFMWLFRNAPSLGFEEKYLQKSCCGIGGDYEFSLEKPCGAQGVPVCLQPGRRLSWDGVHLTQAAYKHMLDWVLPKLHC